MQTTSRRRFTAALCLTPLMTPLLILISHSRVVAP